MLLKWVQITMLVNILTACYASADENPGAKSRYVFSYFKGKGEDGLYLACSDDGLKWSVLNDERPLLQPQVGSKLMRDPCICRGPDGTFHIVWTTGWWDKGIGIAHSTDLIHWSEQRYVEMMADEPAAMNCWAPEIFYDNVQREYLIFWATTIPGRFPETDKTGDAGKGGLCNHRIYCVTTGDFKTYSKPCLFYDDGFSVIDATIVKEGTRYVMFLKDETLRPNPKKHIRIAFADKAAGPYGRATVPISPDWVEGPTAIKIGDYWYVFYDAYRRGRYEGARSKDLSLWEPINEKLSFPKGARHGTILAVSWEIVAGFGK